MKFNILVIPPNDLLRHPIPNRLYHIGKRLAQKHNIYLLSYPNHPRAKNYKLRNMKCIEIRFNPAFNVNDLGLYYIVNAPSIASSLLRLFLRENIDIVINANILPSYLALKLINTKINDKNIITIYDYLDHFPESASAYYVNNPLQGRISYAYVSKIVSYNLKTSTHIVTVSYTLRNIIIKMVKHSDKVTIIPNGVDPELFKPLPKEYARKRTLLDEYEYVLLYYGSIDPWLDFTMLIKCLKKLRKEYNNIVLVLVGFSHNLRTQQELLILAREHGLNRNIVIMPPQPYEKIPLFINASDVVIAPYKRTIKNCVTPLKILESLACTKPVITTYLLEFKLWFTGMPIMYFKDVHELFEKILKVLRYRGDIESKLTRASNVIRTRFSWDKLTQQYEKLMKILLS